MVNWGIAGQNNALANFQIGMQLGQHVRERQEHRDTQDALAAWAANPGDPEAFKLLTRARPDLAIKLREQQMAQERDAQVRQLTAAAAQGDKGAMAQLVGIDFDTWNKLDTRAKDTVKQNAEIIGQAALAADTPEEWDRQVDLLAQQGLDVSAYRGRFDLRETALAQAGLMGKFLEMTDPRYQVIPEGGTLVNTADPGAVQSFVGGGQPSGPQPGAVVSGYRFKGGNPNDKANWEKAGGGGGNATGGFQP